MNLRGKIDFAELTDTGRVREHNEDAIGSDGDIGLMVLADPSGIRCWRRQGPGLYRDGICSGYSTERIHRSEAIAGTETSA